MEGDLVMRKIITQIRNKGVDLCDKRLSLQREEIVIRSKLFVSCQPWRIKRYIGNVPGRTDLRSIFWPAEINMEVFLRSFGDLNGEVQWIIGFMKLYDL